ncbi:unnamed protein product [Musa acuminata var. zebrina]
MISSSCMRRSRRPRRVIRIALVRFSWGVRRRGPHGSCVPDANPSRRISCQTPFTDQGQGSGTNPQERAAQLQQRTLCVCERERERERERSGAESVLVRHRRPPHMIGSRAVQLSRSCCRGWLRGGGERRRRGKETFRGDDGPRDACARRWS